MSAYFTIYAYDALRTKPDQIEHCDFLFGEPTFVNRLDPDKTEKKSFLLNESGMRLTNQLQQKRVARQCADWIKAKVDIRTIKQTNLLHGKMYHVAHAGVEDAIIGSSNFTVRGLGLGAEGNNIELNLVVDSNRDRHELKEWFSEIWNDDQLVTDVKDEVLSYLSQVYDNHSPEFIYYKTLYHVFEKFLGDAGRIDIDLGRTSLFETQIWKALYTFQKDGVKGAVNKILTHNGCIIADSVGLGKTFEALAIIKYFELKNERVLVLCPKKLRSNWTVYKNNSRLNPFVDDRFRFDVLSHTDLSRESGLSGDMDLETLNWGNYDLVVIDESHNFRNNTPGKRDEEGNIIRRSRYQRLLEDIVQKGVRSKVLLLSATPVNNDLKDLRNQLYILTEGADDAFMESLGIRSLREVLASAQKAFTVWAKKPAEERTTKDLLERLNSSVFTLLDALTIARSRKHIQRYYKDSIAELGGFPKRERPVSLYPDIDLQGRFLSYDKLNDEIGEYKLSLFNPSKYLHEEAKSKYERQSDFPFSQENREHYLIGMMKVNFLKRLESSVKAFEITMDRTISKIETLESKIKKFQTDPTTPSVVTQLEFDFADEDEDQEMQDANQVGGKFKYQLADLKLNEWLRDLKKDKDQLSILHNAARNVMPDTDAKLAELRKLIEQKVLSPTIDKNDHPNKKVLVFTAFADTAIYLYESLHVWAKDTLGVNIALVSGSGRIRTTFGSTQFDEILVNFSPRSKNRDKIPTLLQTGEIDILIATDCISEGQNLQDCDFLINYDIHWNPVRIIQRFGRIDRIGSVNKSVKMVNFWPTEDLNRYINLKNRVEARMALVDLAATFEDNILQNEEIHDLIEDDLRYRDKQLMRLKDEVLDLEDLSESVTLTEFTLDDFRLELLKYLEANRETLEAAPLGLYSVVPSHPKYQVITPGVIFCLRHVRTGVSSGKSTGPAESVNPLDPCFLVYVLDDGNVRYGFANPKQVLDIYQLLCSGKGEPYEQLCSLFDGETKNGSEMSKYDNLLEKAIESIALTFRKRVAAGLQGSRGFVVPDQNLQAEASKDFELITWLVIKEV